MGTRFRPHSPSQMLLLPPDLGESLPQGHLAYHESGIADAPDLRASYAPYEGDSRRSGQSHSFFEVDSVSWGLDISFLVC